jgi:hypothetical protein
MHNFICFPTTFRPAAKLFILHQFDTAITINENFYFWQQPVKKDAWPANQHLIAGSYLRRSVPISGISLSA